MKYEKFDGQMFRDGFLHRKVALKGLVLDGVTPTLEELQRFEGSIDLGAGNAGADEDEFDLEDGNRDRAAADLAKKFSQLQAKRAVNYQKVKNAFTSLLRAKRIQGDEVIVTEGDLRNLVGVVHDISDNGNMIHINSTADAGGKKVDLNNIQIPRHQLKYAVFLLFLMFFLNYARKYFRVGDHVKILTGTHESETGMIVKVSDSVAVVLSDISHQELKALISDLQRTAEVSTGVKFGEYALYDLIHLSQNEVGVIVRIEGDTAQVLDPNDKVRTVKLQSVMRKRDTKTTVGRDCEGSPVGVGDRVKIISGQYAVRIVLFLLYHVLNVLLE